MPSTLVEAANKIAAAAPKVERISYGPWVGSMRSKPADQVPREHIAGGLDFRYQPRTGFWKRRGGQTIQFEPSVAGAAGLLPAKWAASPVAASVGALCRQMDEFISDSVSDGIPTVSALCSREKIASTVLDDGRFSNLWLEDQVNSLSYTVGSEFDTTSYPPPGALQSLRFVPLFYWSGGGGITRGVTEFQRRFFFGGSRGFLKVGTETYFPSLYGTPSRWTGIANAALSQTAVPTSGSTVGADWGHTGATYVAALTNSTPLTPAAAATWTPGSGGTSLGGNLTGSLTQPAGTSGFVLKITARSTHDQTFSRMQFVLSTGTAFKTLYLGGPSNDSGAHAVDATLTSSYVTYSFTLSAGEVAAITWGSQPITWGVQFGGIDSGTGVFDFSRIEFDLPGSTSYSANHLIPSGPIPPTHAGVIVKGNPQTTADVLRPDGDVSNSGWTDEAGGTADLFEHVDEAVTDDADFIRCGGGVGASADVHEETLTDPGFAPDDSNAITIVARAKIFNSGALSPTATLAVALVEGTTIRGTLTPSSLTFTATDYTYTLTDAQTSTIATWDWTNMRLRYTVTYSGGSAGSKNVAVSRAEVRISDSTAILGGGWKGKDRFPYAIAYRDASGALWAFTTPRMPSTTLPNGYNICTVDADNPETTFDKITWTNLPVPPHGIPEIVLLRGTKIDSTTDDNLAMDIHDLREVWSVPAGVTEYDDYFADDDAIEPDVDNLLVREDHRMPPPARWIFGGDSRVCHSYGNDLNPCAVQLAPVGFAADYDLNYADDTTSLYSASASYFKLTTSGLTLVRDTGSATSTKTFAFSTYATLEELVDAINATSTADADWTGNGGASAQWRAQVCPAQNTQAACATALCPTLRSITSVVISSTSLTKAAGGLSDVPVGAFITGTGITDGTYVTAIVSDTELTMSASGSSGTQTLSFVAGTGDSITGATHSTYEGYQRVIANSHPGFLYFNTAYLGTSPTQPASIWMTVANPEATKCAANCFSSELTNKHTPPSSAGMSMGGVGIGDGFWTPFSNMRAIIVNTLNSGTGFDRDYKLRITHPASGIIGPVVPGPRCGFGYSPEGWIAADLDQELPFSQDIWLHSDSDAKTGVGDFDYEGPQCVAAAAADTDTAMMYAKYMRGALYVNYRTSASPTHPNRQVMLDFSDGKVNSGIRALVRDMPLMDGERMVAPAGTLYGWSVPLTRSMTQMCEGKRGDGSHLYGWNQANAGSTGDGRIDEFETGDTDNGTAIDNSAASARLRGPWESLHASDNIAGRELVFEHSTPAAAVVKGVFVRAFAEDSYTCTPDVSSSLVVSVYRWLLSLAARVHSAACYAGWYQTSGGASELRRIELQASSHKDYKPGTSG